MFHIYKSRSMTFLFVLVTTCFWGYRLLSPAEVAAAPAAQDAISEHPLKLLAPLDKQIYSGATFSWESDIVLAPNQAFELVLWEDGQDPMKDGFSPIGAGPEQTISVNFDTAAESLHGKLNSARHYTWGVLLVETQPYRRLQYLGGGYRFYLVLNGNQLPPAPGGRKHDDHQQLPLSNQTAQAPVTQAPATQAPVAQAPATQPVQPPRVQRPVERPYVHCQCEFHWPRLAP